MMNKSQSLQLLITWRPCFCFFSLAKFFLLLSLFVFVLNAALSFYPRIPTALHSSAINTPPIFNIYYPSSSSHDYSHSLTKLPTSSSINPSHKSNRSISSPPNSSTTANYDQHHSENNSIQSKISCDLSKGEWVEDRFAPYYSNSTCWTIQEHQNCIKYGRPNLDFLKWRWKPDGCELPLLDPVKFLQFMQGKNLAFAGDSLARNQMQSLMCLLSRVEYPKEATSSVNLTRMVYPNHNFTIWIFWSPFLVRAEQLDRPGHRFPAWNLYLDEPDPLWLPHLHRFDFLVLNAGNWFTRPALFYINRTLAGCHYCPAQDAPFMSIQSANSRAFRTALSAVAAAGMRGFGGTVVVRTVSPAHFEGGAWNEGGDCVRTRPFRWWEAPQLEEVEMGMYREQVKEFWKAKWEGGGSGVEFRLLDATEAMLMRPDGHPSRYGHWPDEFSGGHNDCVHWCLPGPVDMWNDFLFQIISN